MSRSDELPWILPADPKARFEAHAVDVRAAIERVLTSGMYVLGPEVTQFETEFSVYQGGGHTIGVANGTEAIELALRAVGVGRGDRVVTVANTVTATVTAIVEVGAVPVYVDIDPTTMVLDVNALAALADDAEAGPIKAVVPVHLYGQPVDMPELVALASRRGWKVVEDCAQAHGAMVGGRRVGTWGDVAAFSFYPTKNLGAIGDGGGVFTRDEALAEGVKTLRQYGWRERYVAAGAGRNSRLDEMQAAILRAYLPSLDADNGRRVAHAERYRAGLAAVAVTLPVGPAADVNAAVPVFHQFVIRTPHRDRLREHLETWRIRTGVLYPVPVHRQSALAQPEVCLPFTEAACREVLCLPIHPELSEADIDRVITAIGEWEAPL